MARSLASRGRAGGMRKRMKFERKNIRVMLAAGFSLIVLVGLGLIAGVGVSNLNSVAAQDKAIMRELAATQARYRATAKALAARASILDSARRDAAVSHGAIR